MYHATIEFMFVAVKLFFPQSKIDESPLLKSSQVGLCDLLLILVTAYNGDDNYCSFCV